MPRIPAREQGKTGRRQYDYPPLRPVAHRAQRWQRGGGSENQGHGKVSLGGTIVETPCGIASDSLDQTVDFGLISMSDASQDGQSVLIGSRRHFTIKLVNCELASQVKPDFIYRAANVTFDGTADSRDPSLLGVYGEAKGWLSSC